MSGSGGWPVSALPGYLRRTERCPAWCTGPHSTRRLLQSPLLPAPVQCPLHCPALPGVMCYAHNNNVMCHNPDIDVEFCKNIWRSGEGPCQGLSRVNLQSLCNIVKTSSMSSMSKLPNTKNVMCDIIVSRVAARRNKSPCHVELMMYVIARRH